MNIQDKTREALSTLFADMPSPEPETDDGEEGEEKPEIRGNGILEQDYHAKGFHLDVQLEPNQLIEAVRIIYDLGYYLESITGVDWIKEEQLEVVYDFSRYDFDLCRTVVRTRIPRTEPHLPTITPIYTGASWHERETHDFFGIVFDGHPHLVPLLLPEDADFHPLLKDFKA
ncbi:MAG: NADH-quinone oxidoreductase subunit C [Desulfofustis sp.]|nr:NADH-quinone oxidoreductase subunit C [Desulfofustis sp.]